MSAIEHRQRKQKIQSSPSWNPSRQQAELARVESTEVPLPRRVLLIQDPALALSARAADIRCRSPASNLGAHDGAKSSNSTGKEAEMLAFRGRRHRGEGAEGCEKRLGVLGYGGDDDVAVGLDAVGVIVAIDLYSK